MSKGAVIGRKKLSLKGADEKQADKQLVSAEVILLFPSPVHEPDDFLKSLEQKLKAEADEFLARKRSRTERKLRAGGGSSQVSRISIRK
ncbi:MAG: hypothetical protein A2808_02505 [Candidatus Moranbacteria bacterium RIFCSPHIGHO2_01_FULL_55_24]|nr:MAG: hypothetical protein A2808_02505 [Candidatus Moranbacteria bacterium RIFCSPHIGHO2_01_FULL_55_24]